MKLVVRDISKTFVSSNRKVRAIEAIDFEVQKGEFVCLLGPSGCGKTTLLNIIAGLEESDPGATLKIDGHPITGAGSDRVMIFQQDALFPWLNVIDNVEFGLKNKGFPRDKIRPLAAEFLRMVSLSKFTHSYIHTLSGGMKQRVALARALVLNPKMLLMDEPFSSLDAQSREILQDLLQKVWMITGKTILFVTHNIREAAFLGDRVLVLSAAPGRIKKEVKIKIPRPRQMGDIRLLGLANQLRSDISDEIEKVLKEEIDHA